MKPTPTLAAAPLTAADILAYVQAAGTLLGVPLDPERAQRVAGHLARTAALAALLDAAALTETDEPAEIFRPAPFPGVLPQRGTA